MASLVLGAAGAAIGSFVGGPLGANIGWAVGAALGNALFPGQGPDGPRMTDLKVHNSSYGLTIPITYGTIRIAGCVIWQTDWVEHEQHTGGKGGPEQTSYTYTISFAVGICEGPIGGVLRIWADSRLVWDPSTMDPDDFPFTLYLGTETQGPDPTIEAEEGAGNVSGHHGLAYIVFTDFQGKDYNNHLPSLTFEVYAAGGPIPWRYSSFTPFNNEVRAGPGGTGAQSGWVEGGNLVMSWWPDHSAGDFIVNMPSQFVVNTYDLDGNLISNDVDVMAPAPVESDGIGCKTLQCLNNPHIAYAQGGGITGFETLINAFYYDGAISASPVTDPSGNTSQTALVVALMNMPVYANGAVYGCGGNIGAYLAKWNAPGGVVLSGLPTDGYNLPGSGSGASWTQVVDTATGHIWVAHSHAAVVAYDELFEFDEDLTVLRSWPFADFPGAFSGATGTFTVWNNYFYYNVIASIVAPTVYIINADDTFTLADPGNIAGVAGNAISLGTGLVLTTDGIVSLQPRSSGVTLASIVSDISVRAGLTTDQIDVSELTDIVDGYVIGQQMSARSAVEPLQVAWPFDAVEHDVVVKFPRRGVTGVVATLDDNDLGAFIPPGTPPALVQTQRLQEVDLPRQVDIAFFNKDTDYQNGEARARRLLTTSDLDTTLQVPIVMSTQKGDSVANTAMYNAWIERERFALSLSRRWLLLEPADNIDANGRTMRITRKVEQADGLIKIDAVATSLSVYQHLAPPTEGVGMPGGGGTPPTAPPTIQDTDALLLDLPLIRDFDNPVGWYAAFAGATQPTWPGATLYKSIDGGVSFTPEILDTVSDTFGDATTTLGDFTGGNIFDETNSLTVTLSPGSGTLSSVTHLAVLNGANMAAVGIPGTTGIRQIEIIQFRDATLTGTRTYRLTGLLRGRRGSEWMIPQHTSGETFVLLPTSTNVFGDPAELFLQRLYKAVTSGRPLASAGVLYFTNYGIAATPYAPVHLGGGRLVNGDLALTWTRRTRIGGTWAPFTDVPLSEPAELYQIRIYSDSTYATPVRVIAGIMLEGYTYALADQMTDFGSPSPIPVYWGVSQLGTFAYGTEAKGAT